MFTLNKGLNYQNILKIIIKKTLTSFPEQTEMMDKIQIKKTFILNYPL